MTMSAIGVLSGLTIDEAGNSPAGFPTIEVSEPVWREAGNGLSLYVVTQECRLVRPAGSEARAEKRRYFHRTSTAASSIYHRRRGL